MREDNDNKIPLLFWPFYALWRLATFILKLVGRILCGVFGLSLMFAGGAITMTIVAAPVGVAIFALGLLLLIRALF